LTFVTTIKFIVSILEVILASEWIHSKVVIITETKVTEQIILWCKPITISAS